MRLDDLDDVGVNELGERVQSVHGEEVYQEGHATVCKHCRAPCCGCLRNRPMETVDAMGRVPCAR
jgi:hypothetical protein